MQNEKLEQTTFAYISKRYFVERKKKRKKHTQQDPNSSNLFNFCQYDMRLIRPSGCEERHSTLNHNKFNSTPLALFHQFY